MSLGLPPLLITMTEPVGKLPTGFTFQLPHDTACSLIRRRLATPVADLDTVPDAIFDEDDMEHAGLESDPAWNRPL
jgi:hypothetical protein